MCAIDASLVQGRERPGEGPSGGKIGFGANKFRRLSHRFPIFGRMRLVHRAGIARLGGDPQYIQHQRHLQQSARRGRCLAKAEQHLP